MNDATREWVRKAEADHRVASDLFQDYKRPASDQICFLCQQAAEKYLKGILEAAGQPVPKVHDLLALWAMVEQCHPGTKGVRRGLTILTRYGIAPRYPWF